MINKITLNKHFIILFLLLVTSFKLYSQDNHLHQNGEGHQHGSSHLIQKVASKPYIQLTVKDIQNLNHKKLVKIELFNLQNRKPIVLRDLKKVHTQKIHLLIIDDSLQDYSHIHPVPTKTPGVYQFEWQPKKQGNYRIFANIVPIATNLQEYVSSDLNLSKNTSLPAVINKQTLLESVVDGYTFKLLFDNLSVQAHQPNMGRIIITDPKGEPVKDLEPIMGAFAHIVGFNENLSSVVHIHPMGIEPKFSSERGGPVLEFHFESDKVGFIKLFVQVKIHGKELLVPFGIVVQPSSQ